MARIEFNNPSLTAGKWKTNGWTWETNLTAWAINVQYRQQLYQTSYSREIKKINSIIWIVGSKNIFHELLTLSSCHPFDADPPEREHGAVVVDVQESNLVEFFPQDKKHCVQILNSLWDEIPPQSSCHLSQTLARHRSRRSRHANKTGKETVQRGGSLF